MALVEDLRRGIEARDIERHSVDVDGLRVDVLPVGQAVEPVRHGRLHEEHAVVGEMPGDVLEAADLGVLCQQVVQRVEHEVRQPVRAVHAYRRHVALRDRDPVSAGLLAQPGDHRGRHLDAIDLDSAGRQRQGDAAGADRKLENRPATRQLE